MALSKDSNQLLQLEGLEALKDLRVAIVATEWNDAIVAEQLAGAQRMADVVAAKIVKTVYVPGCVELPHACKAVHDASAQSFSTQPEAIIAFGAVIRGGTPHFDYVCKMVTEGLGQLNISLPVPVIFGVLTLDNEAQAWERLGGAHGHKGEEAMITALKMIRMKRAL